MIPRSGATSSSQAIAAARPAPTTRPSSNDAESAQDLTGTFASIGSMAHCAGPKQPLGTASEGGRCRRRLSDRLLGTMGSDRLTTRRWRLLGLCGRGRPARPHRPAPARAPRCARPHNATRSATAFMFEHLGQDHAPKARVADQTVGCAGRAPWPHGPRRLFHRRGCAPDEWRNSKRSSLVGHLPEDGLQFLRSSSSLARCISLRSTTTSSRLREIVLHSAKWWRADRVGPWYPGNHGSGAVGHGVGSRRYVSW